MTDISAEACERIESLLHHGNLPGRFPASDLIRALRAELTRAEVDAEKGRELWAYLIEQQIPWTEIQDGLVDMGLLVGIDVSEGSGNDPCDGCGTECTTCFRPSTTLLVSP